MGDDDGVVRAGPVRVASCRMAPELCFLISGSRYPLPGRGSVRFAFQRGDQRLDGGHLSGAAIDGCPRRILRILGTWMRVSSDEAGHDRLACKIEHFRYRANE